MYEVLNKFAQSAGKGGNQVVQAGNNNPNKPVNQGNPSSIHWDPARSGGSIQLTESNNHCFLKEQSYLFRTTITNAGFTSGVHYWEIQADNRT